MSTKPTRKSPRLLESDHLIDMHSPNEHNDTKRKKVNKQLEFDDEEVDTTIEWSGKRSTGIGHKKRKKVVSSDDEQPVHGSKKRPATGTSQIKKKKKVTFENEQTVQSAKKRATTGSSGKKSDKTVTIGTKPKADEGWFSLQTRSSPIQMYKCIKALKNKQKEAVRKMGFGKLLDFNVSGIPGKLGHYVVDNFDPDKMEIKLENGSIKIDEVAIHNLLGIPCKGLKIHQKEPFDFMAPEVKQWRDRYPGRFVAVSNMVENIQEAEDEDTFIFRLDFLMMFLTVMVECHSQGRCRDYLFKKITKDTDFSQVDWCAYVIQGMKPCKDHWRRCDAASQFAGPLTILTLLYVENVDCKGIKVDSTKAAIEFWDVGKLKRRQALEITRGGFGGRCNNLTAQVVKGHDQSKKLTEISRLMDKLTRIKEKVESKLDEVEEIIPENHDVQMLRGKFDLLLGERRKRQKSCSPGKKISNVLNDINIHFDEEDIDTDSSDEDNDDKSDEIVDDSEDDIESKSSAGGKVRRSRLHVDGVRKKTETSGNQHKVGKGGEFSVAGQKGKAAVPKEPIKQAGDIVDSRETAAHITDLHETGIGRVKEANMIVDGMHGRDDIGTGGEKGLSIDDVVQKLESTRLKPVPLGSANADNLEKKRKFSVNLDEPITDEENKVWKFLMKYSGVDRSHLLQRSDSGAGQEKTQKQPFSSSIDFLFKGENTMVEKYLMKTLDPGSLVSNAVIDAWVDVLNFEEKFKQAGSKRRLFCNTNTIVDWMLRLKTADEESRVSAFEKRMFGALYRNPDLVDLRSFDLIFFPILEYAHFYVMVFDLKCPKISLIDNRVRAKNLSRINDNEDYFLKDTPYKLKTIFVRYLERKAHPKAVEMAKLNVERVKISWATTANGTDCGVFAMRHMERYMGVGEEFDCQFTTEGGRKKLQLEALRKKFAAHILLSKANKLHNEIRFVALG